VEHDKGNNDVLLYLPTYKKNRRVEGQSQSTSFMGSAFSYTDMAQFHADDYSHALVRTEPCPGDAKANCYVIESTPANDAVRDRTAYSKAVQWVRPDNFMPVQGEFYDVGGALWKRLTATNIREVDSANHKWFAHELHIEDVKSKKQSTVQFAQTRVNTGIESGLFSEQNLARE
jgi:outer membrane lipoprotein-sorting protein